MIIKSTAFSHFALTNSNVCLGYAFINVAKTEKAEWQIDRQLGRQGKEQRAGMYRKFD